MVTRDTFGRDYFSFSIRKVFDYVGSSKNLKDLKGNGHAKFGYLAVSVNGRVRFVGAVRIVRSSHSHLAPPGSDYLSCGQGNGTSWGP